MALKEAFKCSLRLVKRQKVGARYYSICSASGCIHRHWDSGNHTTIRRRYRSIEIWLRFWKATARNFNLLFLQNRCKSNQGGTSHTGVQPTNCCPFCGEAAHSAFKCSRFSKMKISERVDAVKKHSLCLNCLSSGHIARTCTRGSCFHCVQRHHSLLHANSSTNTST